MTGRESRQAAGQASQSIERARGLSTTTCTEANCGVERKPHTMCSFGSMSIMMWLGRGEEGEGEGEGEKEKENVYRMVVEVKAEKVGKVDK